MSIEVKISKQVPGFTLDVKWKMGNEVSALFGFSGSGKTMTLQSIAGLLKPDAGYIRIAGKNYFDSTSGINMKTRERRVGYVFQDSALFPHLSVVKNIAFGLAGKKSDKLQKTSEMIELFGLAGLEKAFPCEISGGQKQRVALARALIGNPELLLLDEPLSALDRPIRNKMQEVIKEVSSRYSIPIVLVTHDFSEVQKLADKVIVYSDGNVVQTGSPEELRNNPSCPEVNELLEGAI